MKIGYALPLLFFVLLTGFRVDALPYDYSATIECLTNPHKPQYGGGIIRNPELRHGLRGWSKFGNATVAIAESLGNKFAVARARNLPYDSVSQKLYLRQDRLYTFSAWVQVSHGEASVRAVFKTKNGFKHAGAVNAKSDCWSMLKGGLTVDVSGLAQLYFESENTAVEIWVDSVSLQPFTKEEWRAHQDQSVNKVRRVNVQIKAVDKHGNPVRNATISFQQKKLGFPFGCAINKNILGNPAYKSWFTQRFTVATFEDEMKWYSTEPNQGKEDYSTADAMLQFCKQNGVAVRGHNVLWEDPQYQPGWVKSLNPNDLNNAAQKRLNSVMTKYKGQVIHWDVVNENLHFNFLESKLGADASSKFYNLAHVADPSPILFMNEFNTIEDSRDGSSTPAKYLDKLKQIRSYPGNQNIPMGIGLEAHFGSPNIPYMRSAIDSLAATGLPIWLTEVDVQSGAQARDLEQILREAHSHPQVKGIVIWSAWKPQGCYRMCLTDNSFKNLATGDVVDKLLREWGGFSPLRGTTDANGSFEASLFQGDYEVRISRSGDSLSSYDSSQSFKLALTDDNSSGQTTTMLLEVPY